MKNLFFLITFTTFSILTFSQNKKINKIASNYNKGNYEKCISKSINYIQINNELAAPYYYIAMSYYHQYNNQADIKAVKEISKNIYKGRKKEGYIEFEDKFNDEITSFHKILKKYAFSYYQANKKKSKFYYNYLAKIYNDTLPQYKEVVLQIKAKPDAHIIKLTEKGEINQIDKNGLRQGKWMKVYKSGVTAYEVFFKDDKPVGEFKRFHENSKLASLLIYDENGENASAIFYNDKGEKISEGSYTGKIKTGKWIYYKNGMKIREENYLGGKLHGFQYAYHDNGQVFDKKKYVKGVQEGVWMKFFKNGDTHLKAFVKNGLMDGPLLRFYKNGKVEVRGKYIKDKKEGTWTFYDEEGKEIDVIIYKNGNPLNAEELDKKASERLKKTLEKSKNILDPEDFKNNPEAYKHN